MPFSTQRGIVKLTYLNSQGQLERTTTTLPCHVLRKSCSYVNGGKFSGDSCYPFDTLRITWCDTDPAWEGFEIWGLGVGDWTRICKLFRHAPKQYHTYQYSTDYCEDVVELLDIPVDRLRLWFSQHDPLIGSKRRLMYKD